MCCELCERRWHAECAPDAADTIMDGVMRCPWCIMNHDRPELCRAARDRFTVAHLPPMLHWRDRLEAYLPLFQVAYHEVDVMETVSSGRRKPTGKTAVVSHIVVADMIKRDLQSKAFLQHLQGGFR